MRVSFRRTTVTWGALGVALCALLLVLAWKGSHGRAGSIASVAPVSAVSLSVSDGLPPSAGVERVSPSAKQAGRGNSGPAGAGLSSGKTSKASPKENRWGTAEDIRWAEEGGERDWDRQTPLHPHLAVLRDPIPFLDSGDEVDRAAAVGLVCCALDDGYDPDLWKEIIKANERIPADPSTGSYDRYTFMRGLVSTGLPQARDLMLTEMRHPDEERRRIAYVTANAILGWPEGDQGASHREGMKDWLLAYQRQTGSQQTPNEAILSLINSLEPVALEGLRDEHPWVRDAAASLKEACDRDRKVIEAGGNLDSQVYPGSAMDPQAGSK